MTCIAGIVEDGIVYLAGDSAISTEEGAIFVAQKPKVFTLGEMVLGSAGSVRISQLLQYTFQPPPVTEPLEQYMVVAFMDALKAMLKNNARKDDGDLMDDSVLLVGVRGHLFLVTGSFQASEMLCGFDANGSGGEIARGSLHATSQFGLSPYTRLRMALDAAQQCNAFVRAPFDFVQAPPLSEEA